MNGKSPLIEEPLRRNSSMILNANGGITQELIDDSFAAPNEQLKNQK